MLEMTRAFAMVTTSFSVARLHLVTKMKYCLVHDPQFMLENAKLFEDSLS